jgi:phenylalanyl-tRNA synthetase beta chain
MHPGRTAALSYGDRDIGHVGELHPIVAQAWDLEGVVGVADLDLDALVEPWGASRPFAPFSPYPAVKEDLAVVVDEAVPAEAVREAIRDSAGDLLAEIALFDVYRGPQLGAGHKSLAWALAFQSPDHTLASEEVATVRARIVRELETRLGARLRT